MEPILELDATDQAAAVRRGELSVGELARLCMARIQEVNPVINAVIASQSTLSLQHELAIVSPNAPFSGVPYLAKDAGCARAGDVCHLGIGRLKAVDHRSGTESFLARRFRNGGMPCLGRTNVPQLLVSVTTEPRSYGPTRNPWNIQFSAGGSSGGAAAAVASGMVAVAHANDSGGSIRMPASSCGVIGLKPTRGRVSDGPDRGQRWAGLHHEFAIARSVRDVRTLLHLLSGRHAGDPCSYADLVTPGLTRNDTSRLRIGVVSTLQRVAVEPEIQRVVATTARRLQDLRHHVDSWQVPELEEDGRFGDVISVGIAHDLASLSAESGLALSAADLEPWPAMMLERGISLSATDYVATLDRMHDFGRRLESRWSDLDLLLTPTMASLPARIGELGPDADFETYRTGLAARTAFTAGFNVSGQPAISLPVGISSGGIPIGVQLVAAYGREDLLLSVAEELEAADPWTTTASFGLG